MRDLGDETCVSLHASMLRHERCVMRCVSRGGIRCVMRHKMRHDMTHDPSRHIRSDALLMRLDATRHRGALLMLVYDAGLVGPSSCSSRDDARLDIDLTQERS